MNNLTSLRAIGMIILSLLFISTGLAAPPDNDNLASALAITNLPYTHQASTLEATTEPNETLPPCANPTGASVWYKYTAPSNQEVIFDTSGTDYDTILTVWQSTNYPLTSVKCNDDASYLFEKQSQVKLSLAQGVIYSISVSAYQEEKGTLVFNANAVNPLTNDNLANATDISAATQLYRNVQTTHGATLEANEVAASCGTNDASVWYKYTPNVTQKVILDALGSDYYTIITVWTGTQQPLTEIGCHQNTFDSDFDQTLSATLIAGTTYYISITGNPREDKPAGETGILTLNARFVPANDDLANAIPLDTLPYTQTQTIEGTGEEPNEALPSCGFLPHIPTVWYQYTPASNQNVSFSTQGSDYDTVLSVWTGTTHPLTELMCNDNTITGQEGDFSSKLSMPLTAGATYFINISRLFGDQTHLTFQAAPVASDLQITQPPTDQTIDACQTATLSVVASGTPPFAYQWYQGQTGDVNNPQFNTETVQVPALNQTTSYWVRVTNSTGYVDSNTVTIIVNGEANGIGVKAYSNETMCTTANFTGLITSNNGLNGDNLTLSQTDIAQATMRIQPDTADIGKAVELLMFARYQADPHSPEIHFMRNGEQWVLWDGQISTLMAADSYVKLGKDQTVTIYDGPLNVIGTGNYTVYMGYRLLENGNVAYNGTPIRLVLK
jgi:hypothetical protein